MQQQKICITIIIYSVLLQRTSVDAANLADQLDVRILSSLY